MDATKFFKPWEAPPHYVPAPADSALTQRIQKLAQFASRNGPSFVELISNKQAGNPEYAFLSGGEGSTYFRWILYCNLHSLNPEQPGGAHTPSNNQPLAAQTAAEPAQAASALPDAVAQGFAAVLSALTGSRDSIKTSKEWVMASVAHIDGLAVNMAAHQQTLSSYEKQLHVIYLANDVLLKSAAQRESGSTEAEDRVAQAFRPLVPAMLHSAFNAGGRTSEVSERLSTIVQFWADRTVFKRSTVDAFRHGMDTGENTLDQQEAPTQAPPSMPAASLPYSAPPPDVHMQQVQQQYQPDQQQPPQQPQQFHQLHHLQQDAQQQGQQPWESGQPATPPHAYPAAAQFPPPQPFPQPAPWQGGPPGHYPPPDAYHAMHAQPGSLPLPQSFAQAQLAAPPMPPTWPQQLPAHAAPDGLPHQPVLPFPGLPHPLGMPLAPEAPKPPVDPMSFAPGLIPQLVVDKSKTDPPYSPLSPLDIERAQLPPAQEPNAYLASRLDKFYAELREYRPGMTRAEVEVEARRARLSHLPAPADESARRQRHDTTPSAGLGATAGLGFGSEPAIPTDADAFNSFRKFRSGAYHEVMGRAAAAAAAGT